VNGNRTEKRIEQDAARKRARRAPPPAPAGESKQ